MNDFQANEQLFGTSEGTKLQGSKVTQRHPVSNLVLDQLTPY